MQHRINIINIMYNYISRFIIILVLLLPNQLIKASPAIGIRGVVYDVGLMYGGTTLSVETFNREQIRYDMNVISNILRCNAVRIEGEDLNRLESAARIAHEHGLKIFFNPWKMGADSKMTVSYMKEAAKVAEKLRKEGIDIVFVAGCEYTLFSKGAFPGESFDDRFNWLVSLFADGSQESRENGILQIEQCCVELNKILSRMCKAIRKEFKGQVTYSSGTWENVDWSLFDIVGADYYRRGETDAEYMAGVERYKSIGKPVIVMEMGCCAYKGAAPRGGEGFAVFQGVDENGKPVYEGGIKPERSEREQADYIETQISLLDKAAADGVFVYVFRYPIYPYNKEGIDYDMVSYALVKSFDKESAKAKSIPAWEPKEAFFRLGSIYTRMAE